ncbi:WD40 repeat-like protein [Obba rivulosa]|uniref:WD40 repeat-like protein n=1 Tax=Obba rivulosa TaxID=1052685 RepID=A0A8E2J873_9APHY|nr:WD40 repeat-like protein [Obba rivulosa]
MSTKTLAKTTASSSSRVAKKARISTSETAKPKKAVVAQVKEAEHTPATISAKQKGKQRASTTSQRDTKDSIKDVSSDAAALPSSFKIVAGSYEKLLYGLKCTVSAKDSDYEIDLKPVFIFPAHISSVKAVAASPQGGKWLATGSTDETIKVWDLRRRKELGGLMHHQGSITHLQFPSRSHLLSASEDGTLCLFRARDWAVLRTLKGHKGRVNCVAVHPSQKVALSVGRDRTLRMWDLMRGKGSASTKLGKEGEVVRWSTDGTLFAVSTQSTIDIYSTDMKLLHIVNHPARLHDIKFCKRVVGEGEVLLASAEDKKVSIYSLPANHEVEPSIIAELVGHTNRVKAVETLSIALPLSASQTSTTVVSTISSDGKIHVYDLAALPAEAAEKVQLNPIGTYDTKGTRLTCLTMADGDLDAEAPAKSGKRKRDDADEDDEDVSDKNDHALGSGGEDSYDEDGEEEE